jgi:hypothetical protein
MGRSSRTASAKCKRPEINELLKQHNLLCDLVDSKVFNDLPEYANNAAAIAGGLKIGQLYRTTDTLKVVH